MERRTVKLSMVDNMKSANSDIDIRQARGDREQESERQRGRSNPKAANRFRRDSIEFLIRLSETDPVVLAASGQPGDLINLVWNFYRFRYLGDAAMTRDHAVAQARDLGDALRAEPERLRLVINAVKSLLAHAADGGRFELPLLPGTKAVANFTRAGRRTHFLWSPKGNRYEEGLRQAVIYGALNLLDTEESGMVRRCARKPCGRVFLAARPKQIFCGRRCVNAVVFERYKQKLGAEAYRAKHRETARHSKKVRKQRRKEQ